MPGLFSTGLQYPYIEGLRMDEAMNPLAMMVGAAWEGAAESERALAVRVRHIPWKLTKLPEREVDRCAIRFTDTQPNNTWAMAVFERIRVLRQRQPDRRSAPLVAGTRDASSDGCSTYRTALMMFNGYADQVASLYAGMDLRKYF